MQFRIKKVTWSCSGLIEDKIEFNETVCILVNWCMENLSLELILSD